MLALFRPRSLFTAAVCLRAVDASYQYSSKTSQSQTIHSSPYFKTFLATAHCAEQSYTKPSNSLQVPSIISKMSAGFGQFAATSQFYLYGRTHCTKTGYEEHVKTYEKPDILKDPSLSLVGKVYMITGANAGIGREMTKYLASKGAAVYMVCRNAERANAACDDIIKETGNDNVHVLLCDCSLESEIRSMWTRFQTESTIPGRLDGLVCNAGLLMNERILTKEGVEVTAALHLIFGTYLLGTLAIPLLESTPGSRMIAVSSGGMYNTKWPGIADATNTGDLKYDGQFAYAYAKRGQVLLMEQWTRLFPNVRFTSCHPGWVQTEAVDAAYGENKKYLEPLRDPWQGAEGIVWLLCAPTEKIEGGGFYLDRKPCVKHMAGVFGTEGSYTKNSEAEVQQMLTDLALWSDASTRPTPQESERLRALHHPLKPMQKPVDLQAFMGDWHVLASIPTIFEVGASNCIEHYDWDPVRECIQVTFTYQPSGSSTKSTALMRGYVKNPPVNSQWSMSPAVLGLYVPLGLTYLLVHLADDQSYTIVSVPNREYMWIMARKRPLPAGQTLPVAGADAVTSGTSSGSQGAYMEEVEQQRVLAEAIKVAEGYGFKKENIQTVKWS